MPISSDLNNPRNFITKITRYDKVVNIPNSMTILDELLPISIEMGKRNLTGIWNFTNPGVVSHNEILEMYRDYIDPNFTWKNFNLEEQAKVIVAPRSNNELDATKLKTEFPELLSIKESLIKYVFEPNKKTGGAWYQLLCLIKGLSSKGKLCETSWAWDFRLWIHWFSFLFFFLSSSCLWIWFVWVDMDSDNLGRYARTHAHLFPDDTKDCWYFVFECCIHIWTFE